MSDENTNKANAEDSKGTYVHRFKEPFEYEGKKYETLNFYFEKLKGSDMTAIESEMQANGDFAFDPVLSRLYMCKLASRAGGVGSDVIEAMPLRDFNKITGAARDFLL